MKNIRFLYIFIILIIYIFVGITLDKVFPTSYRLIINPVFFIILSAYLYYINGSIHGRFPKNNEYIKKMIIIVLMYLIIYFFLGLLFGYTRSPYSHSLKGILRNMWESIIVIIGIEFVRSFLLNNNKKNKLFIFITFIIFFLIELNINTYLSNTLDRESAFKYISSIVIPLFASSILYTYLSLKGSYKLVLAYRVIFEIIMLLTPIYPNLDWFATGIIGILVPLIIYILYKYDYDRKKRDVSRRTLKKQSIVTYIPLLTLIIIFALFMLGFFKYSPIAIVSNSMTPVFYRGDVVVLRKVDEKILKNMEKYTIIVYSIGKQNIVHRIIDIKEVDGEIYYQTKGDANNSPDANLVSQDQVIGIYKFSMKYIGYPSVWLSEYFNDVKPKVEIK